MLIRQIVCCDNLCLLVMRSDRFVLQKSSMYRIRNEGFNFFFSILFSTYVMSHITKDRCIRFKSGNKKRLSFCFMSD